MPFRPHKKGTLLIPSGPHGYHLFAIVTDVSRNGDVLIVSFSSVRPGHKHDPTCLVNPGEHRFIKHPSFVQYRFAEVQAAEKLSRMVESWFYRTNDDISDQLLTRIQDGFGQSPFTARRIVNYFRTHDRTD